MTTRASAYVYRGRLCVVGISDASEGPVPFAFSLPLNADEEIADGPVDFGKELPGTIENLMPSVRSMIRQSKKDGQVQLAAEDLVLRARQGDQNAMAILAQVQENAKQGNSKARKAFKMINKYIKANPPDERSSFGRDIVRAENPYEKSAIISTHGPVLNPYRMIVFLADDEDLRGRMKDTIASFGSDMEPSFKMGFTLSKSPDEFVSFANELPSQEDYDAAKVGFIFGKARLLQIARHPKSGFKSFDERAAWELGE